MQRIDLRQVRRPKPKLPAQQGTSEGDRRDTSKRGSKLPKLLVRVAVQLEAAELAEHIAGTHSAEWADFLARNSPANDHHRG